MADETLRCPRCGSKNCTVTAEQMFMVNTGEHYWHSVKTQDHDAKASCLDCQWNGERHHLTTSPLPTRPKMILPGDLKLHVVTILTLTLSTAHIPAHTDEALRMSDNPTMDELAYQPLEGAWLINLWNADQAALVALAGHPELAKLIQLAAGIGCAYLRLDADGGVVEGLPTFSW